MRTSRFAVALVASLALAQQPVDPGTSYLFAVSAPTAVQLQQLQQQFDLLDECAVAPPAGAVQVVVQPEQLAAFQALVPQARLLARGRPFAAIHAEMLANAGPQILIDPGYYTVAEVEQAIDALVAANPAICRKVDLSALPGGVRTIQNRSTFALEVSDNVAQNEDEPAIVVAGQNHAREVNASPMVIGAMQRIVNGYATDPQIQALVNGHELYFVPLLNPDGVDYVWTTDNLWRKNRRNNGDGTFGIDLNRNFPFLWNLCGGSTATSSETYRGPAAATEPEALNQRNLIALLRPELYLDFHSFGQDVLNLWAPCATVSPLFQVFNQRYVDDLRMPMAFNFRAPSASAEAPQDHWGSGGTLSYLIEVGTAFQPPFTVTQAEEARVWPALRHALTSWQPALRGHVRSANGLQPLAATISFAPNQFAHGEVTKGRARDGRYALWLPLGTWTVTWSAPGHQSRSTTVSISSYDTPQPVEVVLEPVAPTPTIGKSGLEQRGHTVTFTYTSPGDTGRVFLIGWSLGTTPGIELGGLRVLPLNNDFLFTAAVASNPVLSPTWGRLDASGQTQSFLAIPNDPVVVGITSWVGGITADPGYANMIKTWSQPVSVTVLQ